MGGTMAMASRAGRRGVVTGASIDRVLDMDLEYISSTRGIPVPVSGVMAKAMALDFRLALMVAAMLASSSAALSMVLDVTTSGKFAIIEEFQLFWFVSSCF